jgi:dipeptidyl aminopeptidase/acylaminoacyl peptidase
MHRVLALVATAALACARAPAWDPVTADPPALVAAHPAALAEVGFTSAGALLNGIVYEAQGAGPHPTAILLHGFPGSERNLDLAQALRRAGWNAVFFHYRGAWGSEGEFGFGHVLEDTAAVVEQVRAPAFAAAHRVDPARLALVGHSMGGFAALVTASERADVTCVVSLAGADLGRFAHAVADPQAAAAVAARVEPSLGPLRGTSGEALARELAADAARFELGARAPALAAKPVLLVAGTRDTDTPPAEHHEPLVDALQDAGAARLSTAVFDADHSFSDKRVALAQRVATWLERECR